MTAGQCSERQCRRCRRSLARARRHRRFRRGASGAPRRWARWSARRAPATPGTRAATSRATPRRRRRRWSSGTSRPPSRWSRRSGTMKGAAMKVGQLASFIDTEFLPPEYRELYQDKLATLRTSAPPMPWKKVREVLDEEWDGARARSCSRTSTRRPPRPPRSARSTAAVLPDGREVAVKVQYPGVAAAIARRHAERRADPAARQGVRARARRARPPPTELKERVLEELDYELEAQNAARLRARLPRPPVHPRARRGHAPVAPSACS